MEDLELLKELQAEGEIRCREGTKDFKVLTKLAGDGYVQKVNDIKFVITPKGDELVKEFETLAK